MPDQPKAKWGKHPTNPNAQWVKARSMVAADLTRKMVLASPTKNASGVPVLKGPKFALVSARKATVSGRPSYVFETADGRLFSVNREGTTMGTQIARDGIPPAGDYQIVATANEASPAGYALSLVAL